MSKTTPLYLDERQAADMTIDAGRGYPPLPPAVSEVCKIVARNLFLSESSVQWAVYLSMQGSDKQWQAIRDKLLGKPVRMR